jgi:hypothetical protein
MADTREHLALTFRLQAAGCRHGGSEFYGDLCDELAQNAEEGGAVIAAMGEFADAPFGPAYHLRLMGGLHLMALSGEVPELRAHYPSTGGDGDAHAAWRIIEPILRERRSELDDALHRPLQTNEAGRAAPLASGMAVVAWRAPTGLPLRLFEIGSSAGLNLRLDRYWYQADGRGWGDRNSPVQFVDVWDDGNPPFDPEVAVVSRRGCDIAPIDISRPGADLRLLSFVWPGQADRFERLESALAIAREMPVDIDAQPVTTWLPEQLATPTPGLTTIVFHSVMWQYLSDADRATVERVLQEAGARATRDAPLAWVRLEPPPRITHNELRLTMWPGGDEVLLATAGFHASRIKWQR